MCVGPLRCEEEEEEEEEEECVCVKGFDGSGRVKHPDAHGSDDFAGGDVRNCCFP